MSGGKERKEKGRREEKKETEDTAMKPSMTERKSVSLTERVRGTNCGLATTS